MMTSPATKPHRIEPRLLKGFRDYLPSVALVRERLMEQARQVFRSYGFAPIDTPALEYAEILLGKGGEESDKQLFRFRDQGDRDVALRFDLTVPLARFAAQHAQELGFPFKRYHLGTVWRGENTQRGRYREFMQCDFDTIGTLSPAADLETLLVIHDLLTSLGFEAFTIRLNNRAVLNAVLARLGLSQHITPILRCLDKLAKVGETQVLQEMCQKVGLEPSQAAQVLRVTHPQATLEEVTTWFAGDLVGEEAVQRLQTLVNDALRTGIPPHRLQVDLSIARGLDYYTGVIFETFLEALPSIGSICSGGRYDDLASLFTTQRLPGIGASLGLDRLLAAMEELGMLTAPTTPAPIFIPYFDPQHLTAYHRLARDLRQAGWGAEVYPEPIPLGKQLRYADRRGHRVALIAGSQEFMQGVWQVKDLRTGSSQIVPQTELFGSLTSLLPA
ncbi:MAG: histidine--tRNA ligase [Planctomycetaceae bacterium]|nr:MAG: histidine--tRNA ligase [Planctomycetaceae bacterium]